MTNITETKSRVNAADILSRAGFEIRGRRANCPYCEGHSRLTVSFTDDGRYFCHRCHRGGHVRQLARAQGISLPPLKIKKTEAKKREFREWLSHRMTTLANEERTAHKKMRWATAALRFYPDFWPAWNYLAWFYSRQRVWERFWASTVDRIGRLSLYKAWRRHGR